MKYIEMVETFDGKRHESVDRATKHLETLLDAAITPLAHKLAMAGKYTTIRNILETETETMREIIAIKNDLNLNQ